jgi:hypothetical protein
VTLTGTGFTGATAVTIGGAAATAVTVVNATTITATTPAGTAGTASVLVTTPGGTNSANTLYSYVVGSVTLSAPSDVAIAAGQTGNSVSVTANASWFAWTATSNASWLTITAGASTTGSGTVTYNVAANPSISGRTGTLTIGGQTLTVTQSGLAGSVSLSPSTDTAVGAGVTGRTVAVTSNAADFAWTATSNASWLTITAGAATTGSGTVTYNVAANATSINSRTGTLTIGGQTLTVTQSGVTGSVTLAPVSYAAPVSGAVGRSIAVTSNATDFAWTATSNASWLTITGGASGTGNGTVLYTVAANAGSERVGTLTIGGRTFSVSQGEKPEIALRQVRLEASFTTGDKAIPLTAEVEGTPGLAIAVRSEVSWLEVTPKILTLPGKLTITPNTQLKPGIYLGIVTMVAEGAEPVFVYVRLTVTEPPQFIALPAAMQLDGSSAGVLYITSRGRQVRYEAEAVSEGGWLSVQPETGMTPVNLRVTANTYFLKPGVHTGTIRVTTRETGGGGPMTIPVTVTVPDKAQ